MLSLGEFECSDVAGWALRPGTPRWSVGGQPLALMPPRSMAGLPGCSAWVWVGPPLLASLASRGSVPVRSVGCESRQVVPLSRLNPKRFLDAALEEQRNGEWRYLEFLQATSLITADIFVHELPGGTRVRHRPRPVDTCPKTDTDHRDQSVPVLFAPLFLEGRFIRRLFRGG